MISLTLLTKEELRELFDGFNTEFLQQPLRRPSKSLGRYVPHGFRPDKMPRNLLIKMFCDAIIGHEPSVTTYVINEITRHFDRLNFEQMIATVNRADNTSIVTAIVKISAATWEDGLVIPAHLVLKLYEVPCDVEIIAVSGSLFKAHFDAIEHAKITGRDEGAASALSDIQGEIKKQGKLQKRIGLLEEINTVAEQEVEALKTFRIELEEKLSESTGMNLRLQEVIEGLNKQIVKLKNEVAEHLSLAASQEKKILELEESNYRLSEMESNISALKIELESARAMAFSDDVVRRLSADVIDELKASSLGAKEILALAKKRFSQEATIDEAWASISSYSDSRIKPLMAALGEAVYSNDMLDTLEEIEDGILIKYAVIKALKGVMYYGLEEKEARKSIADEFAANEE